MKLILIAFLFSTSLCAREYYYSFAKKSEIQFSEFSDSLLPGAQVVLGEYHNTAPFQRIEGKIISDLVTYRQIESDFMVAWEFLNYRDTVDIMIHFDDYKSDHISGDEFIARLFNGQSTNLPYLDFLSVVKKYAGKLYGVNALRSIKRTIIERGLGALDAKDIPPNMQLGNENYFARFKVSMQDHVPPEQIDAFFLAQSYTDSVMAYWFQQWHHYSLNFLIVGAFHSDYQDGVVEQLKKYRGAQTVTVRIVDLAKLSERAKNEIFVAHEKYGAVADYLYVIDDEEN